MKLNRLVVALSALLFVSTVAAAPEAPDAPGASGGATSVAQIEALLAKPDALCGRFDQTKQMTGITKTLVSNGRFCVIAGKGVLWRTLQPFPNTLRLTRDEIVHFQGERVAMRLDAKQEPTVRIINNVLFSLLTGDLTPLGNLFDVDASVNGAKWKVALKGREPALAKAIGAINLAGGKYVTNINIVDASGDRTAIVFSAIETGPAAITPEEAALF